MPRLQTTNDLHKGKLCSKKSRSPLVNSRRRQAQDKFSLKATHKIIVSLTAAALLVALGVAVMVSAFRQVEEAAGKRKQSYALIIRAGDLLSQLRDAETSQRGYLLTGDEAFLKPYLAVRDSISDHLGVTASTDIDQCCRETPGRNASIGRGQIGGIGAGH